MKRKLVEAMLDMAKTQGYEMSEWQARMYVDYLIETVKACSINDLITLLDERYERQEEDY